MAGVPDYVDGSLLQATEEAGARVINLDRMWHYPEGIMNHSPIWSHHGIRILAGPSSLWLDARGNRFPAPLFPGFDALGALRHVTASGYSYSWFVLDADTLAKEFALSGSEQNGDLTGKDLRLLAGRVRPDPRRRCRRSPSAAWTSSRPAVGRRARRADEPAGREHLIDADALLRNYRGPGPAGPQRTGQGPAGRGHGGRPPLHRGRLLRVAPPHELLDPKQPRGPAGPGGPLVAVRLHVLTRKTLGGLETDLEGRVLTADGSPLPGVYAAGEVAGFGGGGVHGYRSLEGTFLGGCLFTGRTVGRALVSGSVARGGRPPPRGTAIRPVGGLSASWCRTTSATTKPRNFSANSGSSRASSASARSRAICCASRIGSAGGSPCAGLELAHLLGDLETLRQQVDQGRVHVVDAGPQPTQLGGHLPLTRSA